MIQFADETTRPQVREMWKTVFGDPDDYMEVYFRHKYRDEATLLRMEGDKVVASLQMLPYRFNFCGREIPVIYLSGVSTLPGYRRKGYVRELLIKSFEEAQRKDVPLMVLAPQEEWLVGFYDRYGFAQTFDAGTEALPSLKLLLEKCHGDLHAAFREFNALFGQKDMTLQKSFDDFRAMVEEAALYDFPAKRNLTGMARVIDAQRLVSLFAACYQQKSFSIRVYDELLENNNALFTVMDGKVERKLPVDRSGLRDREEAAVDKKKPPRKPILATDVRELAQLLLGYHISEKGEPFSSLFPEKEPQMHFMLE
ncbi:GNAT family N-acetyltransferase [Proteiniphilum sp. X52]|uniref:GNAT family N-acetyltransferase n=1 Tax=Proteiniphilum sp. X52 TaxID=2382159 RepID=UPI000F09AC75|nr:GNAT family N-acetyltransferase [Proteiniphilum sp. X52]RNC64852.1 GNAT family N-acetyltransferase [Proteiniphilum sp. X52]